MSIFPHRMKRLRAFTYMHRVPPCLCVISEKETLSLVCKQSTPIARKTPVYEPWFIFSGNYYELEKNPKYHDSFFFKTCYVFCASIFMTVHSSSIPRPSRGDTHSWAKRLTLQLLIHFTSPIDFPTQTIPFNPACL